MTVEGKEKYDKAIPVIAAGGIYQINTVREVFSELEKEYQKAEMET